jgi:Concanavalin A-like lectin/glucanases superfamily
VSGRVVCLASIALAGLATAACGKARSKGLTCLDGVACPGGQTCVDGECVTDPDGGGAVTDAGSRVFIDVGGTDFEAGELENLEFAGDRVQLRADLLVGELRSRVFDAGETVRWTRLRWTPARPYGKPLPGGRGQDEGYEAGIDMAENVLLLHFDESGPLADTATLADSSGRANDAVLVSARPIEVVAGVFGAAVDDRVDSRMRVDGTSPDLQFGTGDYTWSMWIKAGAPCESSDSNDAYIGGEELGSPRTHLWMGCLIASDGGECSSGPPTGRPAAVVCSDQPNDCAIVCGTSNLPDGDWHHIAVRKSGHPDAEVTLWFDGAVEGTRTTMLAAALGFDDGTDLGVGHFGAPPARDSDAQGALDEVAVFRRGLSDDEVRELYLRGVVRLGFQARVCAEPDCGDQPAFVGPDGTEATTYEDARDEPARTPVDLAGLPDGRYLQYRAMFETAAGARSPQLLSVEVEAEAVP